MSECSEGQSESGAINGFHGPGLAVVPLMLHWRFPEPFSGFSEDVVDMSVLLFSLNSTLEKNEITFERCVLPVSREEQLELLAASISQVTFQKRCKSIRHQFHAWSPIRCILVDGHTHLISCEVVLFHFYQFVCFFVLLHSWNCFSRPEYETHSTEKKKPPLLENRLNHADSTSHSCYHRGYYYADDYCQ